MALKYSSTRTVTSSVYPEIRYTLKRSNEKRRAELMRLLAPLLDKERELQRQFADLQDRQVTVKNEDGSDKLDTESCEVLKEFANHDDLQKATDIIQELNNFRVLEVYPVYLQWGLANIEGLEINDKPVTIQDLNLDEWPDGLAEEILNVMQGKIDLTAEEKKIASSPSTIEEQPQGILPTSATPVSVTETSLIETVLATTPA